MIEINNTTSQHDASKSNGGRFEFTSPIKSVSIASKLRKSLSLKKINSFNINRRDEEDHNHQDNDDRR